MAQGSEASSVNRREGSILPVLARICDEEERWVDIDPPTPQQEREEPNIIGNWVDEEGRVGDPGLMYPIKAGFMMRTEEHSEKVLHKVYRTSKYNLHYRLKDMPVKKVLPRLDEEEQSLVKEEIKQGLTDPEEIVTVAQVFVREAPGYGKDDKDDE